MCWNVINGNSRYEQFSMSPKIFLNFNLLRTDQINCNRLAAYSFACFNERYVCQITGDRQKERVKKIYIYGKSNCNSIGNTNSNINILPSLNNFHIENMYNSDTNRTFIVAGKIYWFQCCVSWLESYCSMVIAIHLKQRNENGKYKFQNGKKCEHKKNNEGSERCKKAIATMQTAQYWHIHLKHRINYY